MPREVEPPIVQREFVLAALKEKLRVDGRGLLQGREPTLEFGDELGVVECSLGKTRYVKCLAPFFLPFSVYSLHDVHCGHIWLDYYDYPIRNAGSLTGFSQALLQRSVAPDLIGRSKVLSPSSPRSHPWRLLCSKLGG